jgi:Protein of unknown function (DUF3619)
MNSFTPLPIHASQEALASRYALRVAARLTEHSEAIGPDIAERLRFGREQALQRAVAARQAVAATPAIVSLNGGGSATLSGGPSAWWLRIASVLPLLALVAGLLLIERLHSNSQISAAAEIDAALLADDLPPRAYSDVGFLEFLKTPKE